MPPQSAPATSPVVGAQPSDLVTLGPGYTFDPNDLTPGYPDVVTIRLGERLRIYSTLSDWTPATLALLDAQENVLWCSRLDLPPRGSVTGRLPIGLEPAYVRFVRCTGDFAAERLERRIGVPEPELSPARMKALGINLPQPVANQSEEQAAWSWGTVAVITDLSPGVGRVIVASTTMSYCGVAAVWQAEGPAPDAHWLSEGVRNFLEEQRGGSPATQP